MNKLIFSLVVLFVCMKSQIYSQYIPSDFLMKIKESNEFVPISIAKNVFTERYLHSKKININNKSKNWFYLGLKSKDYYDLLRSEIGKYVYVETSEPIAMNDSSRITHQINEVHNGLQLPSGYTGKNVVVGIIDSGVDFLHDDFKDNTGKTRIYRYWDQSDKNPTNIPKPYNYGMVWTKKDIDNGICSAVDNTGHGTNVTGIAAGNGKANGKNKGIAPDATIVFVETNLSASNWTLTVADACDYIFKVADSLGLPAVINISNGVQFGSHDGTDPASEKIEALLDEKPGRILVASAGNSGNSGKYHIHVDVDKDTSFYWVKPSVNGIAGVNSIYVDMWSDSIDFADILISSGANLNSGKFTLRGKTPFRNFQQIYAKSPGAFRDTVFGFSGNRLAYVDYYASIVNHVARIEWVVTSIDSNNYYYQFRTTGKGNFDGWSGELNKRSNGKTYSDFITTNLPDKSIFPAIKDYVEADTLQTIFSSYISSEKVVTVGNISNRDSYKAKDGNTYFSQIPHGQIFISSSKGPNRKNIVKPDIVACGNFTLTAAPLYVLSNPLLNNKIDEGGMHYVNGGTSMSSPLIAGIAALYLEKCSNATYQDFKNELTKSSSTNQFTGSLPNYAYGFGIANAFKLLRNTNNIFSNIGDSIVKCAYPITINVKGKKIIKTIIWNDQSTSLNKTVSSPGYYSFVSLDDKKCISKDSFKIEINNSKPNISFLTTKGSLLNCNISSTTLKVKGTSNYNWSGMATSNLDSVIAVKPGKYFFSTFPNTPCEAKDSVLIKIDTLKPTIKIITAGISSISCLNEPVKLKVTGGTSYLWNSGTFLTRDSNLINLPGVYWVFGKGINGCSSSDTITVTKDPNPPVLIVNNSLGQAITCKQKSINLSAIGGILFTWNRGLNLSGPTNLIADSGMVVLTGIDSKGCIGKDSLLIIVDTVRPKLNLKFVGSTSISCNNDPVDVEASGAVNYLWSGGNYLNYPKNSFSKPGKYYLTGTNTNGCFSRDSVFVTKNTYPPTPTIDYKDSVLISSKSINYQWFKNGIELINDTLQSLKIKENGVYMVSVNLNGCVSTSKYLKTNLAIENLGSINYEVFPNPLQSNLIEIKNLDLNSSIEIKDVTGKNIEFQKIDQTHFEIKNIINGLYFISIFDGKQKNTFKILKN